MVALKRATHSALAVLFVVSGSSLAWAQNAHADHQPSAPAAPAPQSAGSAPANSGAAMPAGGMEGHQGHQGSQGKPQGGSTPMQGGMMGHGMPMCSMMGGGMRMSEHVDQQLGDVRGQLAITPGQTAAWEAYATAVRGAATQMDRHHETMMTHRNGMSAMTPIERLDNHDRMLATARESIRSLRAPLANLYALLSAEQKAKANDLLKPPCMMEAMPMRVKMGA